MLADRLPVRVGDIVVRKLNHADAEPFAHGTDDDLVRRFGHLPLTEYTADVVRAQIDGVIAAGLADGSLAVLAIADAESDAFLGSVVLFDIRADRLEVGFWLSPAARGRGAARKAVQAAEQLATSAGCAVVEARTSPANSASVRVLEQAGFHQRGSAATGSAPSGEEVTLLMFEKRLE
ncbi:GNAT family N-acetyltransferase [Nocardia vermiculata]|uniref:GNAT family N-acetyltransferase n=1 Tax=Nocardia vermiculata TaxID=257274 RepID=A0A846XUC7_9NOCA|nr:GNAT family protein [Nocardia vermiculata]NKY49001.1 GNAT family N-acetyltransferase [Nocardia vermiculata]